jgi:hypothetical protein
VWWPQRRCQATWGRLIQPQGFGRWRDHGTAVDFFLECDHGEEPISITAALAGYDDLADAVPQLAIITLLWMVTTEREAQVRRTLHPHHCRVATATPPGGGNPADAVWLPLGTTGPRRRLGSLADPHCWASERP